ncbi:putative bifunctional diguanylate cyclase/phosphodiesterase [Vreelandella salicampi]|uniref:cyclic-guanylate-specific phosphodiesterase n=1 Tax=Vreelandella salicampi TaxID=1449798 RepID=A0A7Z0RVW9_9GAMM|nr:EAL domain-containing protein [Halomonas salicampi]NYS62033.1 EAL domain-containing protein [Halomonas salicampi]
MNDDFLLLEAQKGIHQRIARRAPLPETLDGIAQWIEQLLPDAIVAFMVYDAKENTLRLLPSPHFSANYHESLQRVEVAPDVASFGTAAHDRNLVVTEDIASDSRWNLFRDAALSEGLHACWSSPVIAPEGELLGTFSTYYRTPKVPTAHHQQRLRYAAALISLALVSDRDTQRHRKLAEQYRSLLNGNCRDATERKRQNDTLRLLSRGIEASPNGVVMADALEPDMPIVFANPAFLTMTGYSHDEVIGSNCRFLQGPETDASAIEQIRAGIFEQCGVSVTLLNYCKDGSTFWNQLDVRPVFDDNYVCSHFIGIQQDITEQKMQEARIAYQATHDLLTGLYNLTAFTNLLEDTFQRSQQESLLMAMMYLDLDGFKAINDGLGHHIGNQVLDTVSKRLVTLLNPVDVLARLGGDEFGILLTHYGNRNNVIQLAERILDTLSQPIEVDDQLLKVSASIGIACNCLPLEQSHEIVQHADLAVEEAKRQGRNTWQWYRGRQAEKSRHNVLMRHDLHTAIREDQFEMHYQPLIDAQSGCICSVEALVRWRHPTRGMISPGEFIPLAEQTGQIIPLGNWILNQACRDLAELRANTGRELPVAVNISSLQFYRDGFLDEVKDVLARSGLPPELLELEITESVLLDGAKKVIELMETLKEMGVRVALDDFGTGFSSLSYLCDLPAHKLKLDRSFVQKAQHDHRTAAIVQGVITMAHHMEMIVVAEGVETREEQQGMIFRQCDVLQGFLFSRPLPLNDLITLPEYLIADVS